MALWGILSVIVAIVYALFFVALLAGFVFNIVKSVSVDRIISRVTVFITCGASIGIIAMQLIYLLGAAITAWWTGASVFFFVFGNTILEMAFILLALYHTACVVQKAKDSDSDRGKLCLGVQIGLIILAVITVVVGAFPTIVLGMINFIVVTGAAWYQWLWMIVFLVNIAAIGIISCAFYVMAIQSDVPQKQATTLLFLLCLIFLVCTLLTLVLNFAQTILAYFLAPELIPILNFLVLIFNRLWSVLLLAGYLVVFLPFVNRSEGLSDM